MNFLKDLSNIILYSLFVLDSAYAFVINNKDIVKSIRKTSSDKDLQVYHASTCLTLDKSSDAKVVKYIEAIEYLDDGEVAWEIPHKIFPHDKNDLSITENSIKPIIVETGFKEYKKNPTYSVLSGIVKGFNKEIFQIDTFYDIVVGIYASKNHSYFSNIIFVVLATFLKYGNSFIIKREIDLLKDSYETTQRVEYVEQYVKIRRVASTIILLLAFILTKNVQIAE